jgi:hypothetical protein
VITRWKAFYGDHPLHLLAVLACLALAGYAALGVLANPVWLRMLIWFGAAIVAHDLVVFPLYAAADRVLNRVRPGPGVNYLRVPLLGVALTFLLFFPGIIRQGAGAYRAATGLTQEPFLARWLLLCAAMFAGSLLVYAVRWVVSRLGRGRHSTPAPVPAPARAARH